MKAKAFFQLLRFKTFANLKTEVAHYYLNYLWWGIEPILTMGVFYIVFGIFLSRGTQHYVAFLLCGLTWWNWFVRSVQNSANSILQGKGLMMQVDIPKLFFPFEVCLRDAFKQLFVTFLLLTFLVFYPTPVGVTWLALPVLVAIQALLILGAATLCAAVVPFVPDLKLIVSTGLQLLFFGSGIFYRIEDVVLPEHRFWLYLNPMAGLIKNYRSILLEAQWPDWGYLVKVACFGVALCLFSFWLVTKFERVYPRVCNR